MKTVSINSTTQLRLPIHTIKISQDKSKQIKINHTNYKTLIMQRKIKGK